MDPLIQEALAQARVEWQRQALHVAFPVLMGFYVVVGAGHWVLLESPVREPMAGLAALSALFFGVGTALRSRPLIAQRPALVATAFTGVVLLNSLAHIALTRDILQTTNLVLVVVGAAILLADARVFLGAVATAWLGYSGVTSTADPYWVHFAFALFNATVLSGVAFVAQRRSMIRRVEAEHAQRQVELQRRVNAAALLDAESRYRVLVSMSPTAILVTRGDEILFANRAAAHLLGSTLPAKVANHPLMSIFPEDEHERFAAWRDAVLSGESEERLTCKLAGEEWPQPRVELAAAAVSWEGAPATLLQATTVHSA